MKKIFFLSLIGLFLGCHQYSLADGCTTGYACLLKDIKLQESAIQSSQEERINNYFEARIQEPALKEIKDNQKITYRDILPFAPKFY